MKKKPARFSKRTLLMWGIPIIILLVLIVLLISELADDEDNSFDNGESGEGVVIQATDSNNGEIGLEVKPVTKEDDRLETEMSGQRSQRNDVEERKTSDERERSFILEEGDSLWKIAQRKDVLDDARKWRTILIQNKEKINYTIFSEETGQWKVMVDAGKRLVFKSTDSKKSRTSFDRTRKKRYAVQLMSLNLDQLERAVNTVKFLIQDGYHAYLYRTREKIKTKASLRPQYYYRIRVGFYETEREALDVGENILYRYENKNIFPSDYWAVLPSYSELNGELIDFGIQRNNPWIIQLEEMNSRAEAINTLKKITSLVDFCYISQKQRTNGKFKYRIRVGFFETKKAAQKVLSVIQSKSGEMFYNAKTLEIRHVMETAPGQSLGEPRISKIHQ